MSDLGLLGLLFCTNHHFYYIDRLGIDIDNLSDLDSDEEKDTTSDNSNSGTSEAGRSSASISEDSSVKNPVTDSGEHVSNSNEEPAIGAGVHTEGVEEIISEKQDSLSKAEETNKETCTGEVTSQTQEMEKKEEREKEQVNFNSFSPSHDFFPMLLLYAYALMHHILQRILVYIVCFHEKIKSEMHLNIYIRCKK